MRLAWTLMVLFSSLASVGFGLGAWQIYDFEQIVFHGEGPDMPAPRTFGIFQMQALEGAILSGAFLLLSIAALIVIFTTKNGNKARSPKRKAEIKDRHVVGLSVVI